MYNGPDVTSTGELAIMKSFINGVRYVTLAITGPKISTSPRSIKLSGSPSASGYTAFAVFQKPVWG